jgi:DNA (cytosine-5)-methyltransferase 1
MIFQRKKKVEKKIRHGSLFSGIGGFDFAAEQIGWENVFHCEWNPFGQKILKYYWPKAISYEDIKKTDFSIHRGQIDILTGGFPCQPYSTAGKRKGKEDDRHLWPEMLRAIREIQPSYVVGENVRGLTNWNGGMVFDEVQSNLEAEGFEVLPFLLPACAVNAPHRRDRIWFIAYSERNGHNGRLQSKERQQPCSRRQTRCVITPPFSFRLIANTESNRNRGGLFGMEKENGSIWKPKEHGKDNNEPGNNGEKRNDSNPDRASTKHSIQARGDMPPGSSTKRCFAHPYSEGLSERISGRFGCVQQSERTFSWSESSRTYPAVGWREFPTQSPVCNGDDGLSFRLDTSPLFKGKRKPNIKYKAYNHWRNESIKGGGNAIVPRLALQIFKVINDIEKDKK